jgi:hypothetical protein
MLPPVHMALALLPTLLVSRLGDCCALAPERPRLVFALLDSRAGRTLRHQEGATYRTLERTNVKLHQKDVDRGIFAFLFLLLWYPLAPSP